MTLICVVVLLPTVAEPRRFTSAWDWRMVWHLNSPWRGISADSSRTRPRRMWSGLQLVAVVIAEADLPPTPRSAASTTSVSGKDIS
ncbi:hypothetical protein ACQEU5_06690 [Marinactinospora thermotolerans]|uniref:hypothetical protein n=1 Tax=Marinactinospora thermotolerans TaxID=531310 RepID=UPI0011853070|nr:hypothetical protein [Marinactinospora thermotolerans]